jgi:hypothetical protein
MKIGAGTCQFENGGWQCTFPSQKGVLMVYLAGDSTFFSSLAVNDALEKLVAQADKIVDDALAYAKRSVYRSDIEACGGIRFDSIVVASWTDLFIWFQLNYEDRMLGVRVVSGIPVDTYCDVPESNS